MTANDPATVSDLTGVVIQRTFDAPRELVFKAWTDPKHLAQWWGPRGFSVPHVELDVRPGGVFRVDMQGEDGVVQPGSGTFEEIAPHHRLVLITEAFPDADGSMKLRVRHTVTFEETGANKTALTLRAAVLKSSPEVRESVKWMKVGWESSFDKLDDVLAAVRTVRSADGTLIAFKQTGSGPALILVTGALGVYYDEQLPEALSDHFTVISYARRGRGESGDTPPYAVQREIEDIEALIDHVGGSAYIYGISSGAALALEAANALPGKITKAVLYEPPFIVDDTHPPVPDDYVQQLQTAVAEGRRGDAVEIFMVKAGGGPQEFVDMMRNAPPTPSEKDGTMQPPAWSEMEAVAHTLAYDGLVMGTKMSGKPLAPNSWPNVTIPVLFVTGGNSGPFFANGAQDAIRQLPDARHRVLEGQDHAVSPVALAPLLVEFFSE
jgi:uncharacterized protein YndB with AHSA1/START domain/pimeloyl-ACP methyl ester carboxylesterase